MTRPLWALACVLVLAATAPAEKAKGPIREGPRPLAPAAAGVGRMAPDVKLRDISGRDVRLKEFVGKSGLVVAFTNTTCPICKKYGPTLAKLEKALSEKGLPVLFVNPTASDKIEDVRAFIKAHGLKGTYVHDKEGSFSRALGAITTAEAFLLDARRTVVYRGAVDDQYGLGYSLGAPKRNFLLGAVAAHLAGDVPAPAATTAPGCELDHSAAKATNPAVTYHNRISRIVQANCAECHRKGGVAPFSLRSYDEVVSHAGMIRKVVQKGTMPPWFAAAEKGKPSPWINDRSLNPKDRDDLLAWLAGGRPKGDEADAPLPRSFGPDGFSIGKPDVVYQMPKPYAVKATGALPYQNFTVETGLKEDRWVQALEVRPGARSVVHHVVVFVLPPGPKGAGRAGFFALYVPGNGAMVYPEGLARKLPRGSRLRFQMHYTPDGTARTDQTRLGLVFAKKPPQHEVRSAGIVNTRLVVPAGADNHSETASVAVPAGARLLSLFPHMHLRGKAFRFELLAGGKKEVLLDVPRYDFNWQLTYRYAEPPALPAGATVRITGWYDNSEKNPANPDPRKEVRWGEQTSDEMLAGFVEYYVDGPPPGPAPLDAAALFKRVDTNGDGKISRAEYDAFAKNVAELKDAAKADALFKRIDANKDGAITLDELLKFRRR